MTPTSYPGGLDTLTNPNASDSTNSPSHASQHSDVNDAIEAIETELGVNPSGASASVASRFSALDALVAAIDAEVTIGTSPPGSPTLGCIWVDTNSSPPAIKEYNGSTFVNAIPTVSAPQVGLQSINGASTSSSSYVDAGAGITLNVTKGRVFVILVFDVYAAMINNQRAPTVGLRIDSSVEAISRIFAAGENFFNLDSITIDGGGHVSGWNTTVHPPAGQVLAYMFTGIASGNHTFTARIKINSGSIGTNGITNALLIAMEM